CFVCASPCQVSTAWHAQASSSSATAWQNAKYDTPEWLPSSTIVRGRVACTSQLANGTCPHQALVVPCRADSLKSTSRPGWERTSKETSPPLSLSRPIDVSSAGGEPETASALGALREVMLLAVELSQAGQPLDAALGEAPHGRGGAPVPEQRTHIAEQTALPGRQVGTEKCIAVERPTQRRVVALAQGGFGLVCETVQKPREDHAHGDPLLLRRAAEIGCQETLRIYGPRLQHAGRAAARSRMVAPASEGLAEVGIPVAGTEEPSE